MARTSLAGRDFEWAVFSDIGGMAVNEDCVLGPIRSADGRLMLWAVADGLGGQGAGDQASSAAVQACDEALRADTSGTLPEVCRRVIERAHHAVVALRSGSSDASKAASTLTFLVTDGSSFALGHVGDSRAYRFRARAWMQLSEDHSVAAALAKAGLAKGELRSSPDRSQLVSALGSETMTPQLGEAERLCSGDTFLLCSDGVWEPVTEDKMLSSLGEGGVEAFLARLHKAADSAKGAHRDNFSAIAIVVGPTPAHIRRETLKSMKPLTGRAKPKWDLVWNRHSAALMIIVALLAFFTAGFGVGRWTAKSTPPVTEAAAKAKVSPALASSTPTRPVTTIPAASNAVSSAGARSVPATAVEASNAMSSAQSRPEAAPTPPPATFSPTMQAQEGAQPDPVHLGDRAPPPEVPVSRPSDSSHSTSKGNNGTAKRTTKRDDRKTRQLAPKASGQKRGVNEATTAGPADGDNNGSR